MKKESPKGWTCKCGHFTPFTVWVYAHWKELLTGACLECGKRVTLYAGKVRDA